jgi:hypothetical protein
MAAVDFDKSGTYRSWVRADLGPSVGMAMLPLQNVLAITAAGTFTLTPDVTLVQVNVAGAVTIILPRAAYPPVPAIAVPGLYSGVPVVVVDVGGNAGAHPITIQPAAGETIMGLASIQITAAYGGYTLTPNSAAHTWNAISP